MKRPQSLTNPQESRKYDGERNGFWMNRKCGQYHIYWGAVGSSMTGSLLLHSDKVPHPNPFPRLELSDSKSPEILFHGNHTHLDGLGGVLCTPSLDITKGNTYILNLMALLSRSWIK